MPVAIMNSNIPKIARLTGSGIEPLARLMNSATEPTIVRAGSNQPAFLSFSGSGGRRCNRVPNRKFWLVPSGVRIVLKIRTLIAASDPVKTALAEAVLKLMKAPA
jgi:hypothetical protein